MAHGNARREAMDWTPPPDGIESCQGGGGINATRKEKASMEQVSIIGIDLAKNSFQLHGARADGSVAFRKKLGRGKVLDFLAAQPSCVVATEACASAHYWGREIEKLSHEVRLIPPIYVKPFVKRYSYQDTSLRYSKSNVSCSASDADGNSPAASATVICGDLSASTEITHGAPLQT